MTPYTTRHYLSPQERTNPIGTISVLSSYQRSRGYYDLYSVVVHKGRMDAGHYITYCRRDGQWFLFDDDKVTLASEKMVLGANPYLLFYVVKYLSGPTPEEKIWVETGGVSAV